MIRTFRLLRPMMRRYRRALALGVAFAVAEVVVSLAQPWPLSQVIDRVLTPGGANAGDRMYVAMAVAALLALVGLTALADYWSTRLLTASGLHLGSDLRAAVFQHLQRLSLTYHGERQVGDLSSRVTGDADRAQDMVVQVLSVLVPNGLLVIGMFAVMATIDPWFALLSIAVSPPLALNVVRSTRRLSAASKQARRLDGQVSATATESLSAVHLVQAFSLEHAQNRRFGTVASESVAAGLETARLQARFSPMIDVASAVATGVVLWFGADRVIEGRLSLGVLLVFLSYLGSLYKPIKAIAKLGTVTAKGVAAAERVMDVLATEPQVRERSWARPMPRGRGRITFDAVHAGYGDVEVLRGVDLDIESGETLAIVGTTGAGKTTLVSLVPRLADPRRGRVLIDGHDLRDATLASVRAQTSMVLQDSVLLRGTLRSNIAVGRPGATDAEVARAADLALVSEFAARLPDGLDTMIGERGVNLSGGQCQRVAIARAILRDSPILVLDEPTSALDAQSEDAIVEALRHLPAGRTTLVIAHRLSTVRTADRIVVLEHGLVVEQGSHAQLLRLGGRYRHLVELQFATDRSAP
jgi:ABC-type multidrug transport system fused ATPase/permease subunit